MDSVRVVKVDELEGIRYLSVSDGESLKTFVCEDEKANRPRSCMDAVDEV